MKTTMLKGVCTAVAAVAVASSVFAEDPKAGETWRVSTETLVLRKKPNGLSKAVATLKYNDAAEVVELCRYAIPFDGDKDKFPETLIPLWVKVKAGGEKGYLPFPAARRAICRSRPSQASG